MRPIALLSSLSILASMVATGSVVADQDLDPWHDFTRPEKWDREQNMHNNIYVNMSFTEDIGVPNYF